VQSCPQLANVEDDERGLAAHLHVHALERLGGVAHHGLARAVGARDGDQRDVGVAGQRAADLGTRAGHDVEHAGGQACLERQAGEHQRGQRRVLRRLEHDAVARGERRADLPRRHVERVVPGRDRGAHAERLAHDRRAQPGDVLAGRLALEGARGAGEEAQVVDGQGQVERRRELQRLAGVGALHARELVGALLEQAGQMVEHGGALARGDAAPVAPLEGGLGGGDGAVGIGGGAVGDLGDGLARARIVHGAGALGGHVLAVDEHVVALDVVSDGHRAAPICRTDPLRLGRGPQWTDRRALPQNG
jgi:hypothetical protein